MKIDKKSRHGGFISVVNIMTSNKIKCSKDPSQLQTIPEIFLQIQAPSNTHAQQYVTHHNYGTLYNVDLREGIGRRGEGNISFSLIFLFDFVEILREISHKLMLKLKVWNNFIMYIKRNQRVSSVYRILLLLTPIYRYSCIVNFEPPSSLQFGTIVDENIYVLVMSWKKLTRTSSASRVAQRAMTPPPASRGLYK